MKPGGGKRKGASFERAVCKQLSMWVSHGKQDDLFWRSAMSGGRSTVMLKRGKVAANQAGDISAISDKGYTFTDRFFVECKNVRDLQLHRFLMGKGLLADYWVIASKQARKYGKQPLLICKQSLSPTYMLTRIDCLPNNFDVLGVPSTIVQFPPVWCQVFLFSHVLAMKYPTKGRMS